MPFESSSKIIERMQNDMAMVKNRGFTTVKTTFVQSDGYSVYEKIIYMILKSFCFTGNICWPSISTIAKKAPCGRNTVIKAIRSLQGKGVVEKINGEHASQTYKLKIGPFHDTERFTKHT